MEIKISPELYRKMVDDIKRKIIEDEKRKKREQDEAIAFLRSLNSR